MTNLNKEKVLWISAQLTWTLALTDKSPVDLDWINWAKDRITFLRSAPPEIQKLNINDLL